MNTIKVRSHEREEMIEITDEVRKRLKQSDARDGVCILFVQHTTAGLTINENADPDVVRDILSFLRETIPQRGVGGLTFRHAEGNSDAHLKASFFGSSVAVPFEDGELLLGRWQGIYLCEFDGTRERQVIITMM